MDYDIIEARYLHDFAVWVRCRDGASGAVDLRPVLRGPVFEPLKDPAYFRNFVLDSQACTLVWPNGADAAPEFLHDAVRVRA